MHADFEYEEQVVTAKKDVMSDAKDSYYSRIKNLVQLTGYSVA